jgi:cation-transporting P-type ATPase C
MNRTINQLRRYGVDEIILLTGDKQEVAKDTASKLSLDAYYAEALPEDKANIIKSYRHKGNPVMMVGDGINDSPALAYADVGVTLGGKRTDIAAETCDVIITGDDPASLTRLVDLSQNTIKVIQQNFHATIVINSLAMLLGATGTITPVMSAVLHNAATIGVVLNSSRMLISKN